MRPKVALVIIAIGLSASVGVYYLICVKQSVLACVELLQGVRKNDVAQVHSALQHGADPNVIDPGIGIRGPLLNEAVINGRPDIARALLDSGANPNSTVGSQTALIQSTSRQCGPEMAGLLLKAGANPNVVDRFGQTAVDSAAFGGRTDLYRIFIHHGATPSIHGAASIGDSLRVAALIRAGNDPNKPHPSNGLTPLDLAVFQGHLATVRTLLKLGADPRTLNTAGTGVADVLALPGNRELRQLLQDQGVNLPPKPNRISAAASGRITPKKRR